MGEGGFLPAKESGLEARDKSQDQRNIAAALAAALMA
jgi:hypothetical protein